MNLKLSCIVLLTGLLGAQAVALEAEQSVSAEQLAQGEKLYTAHCSSCHDAGVARAPATSMLRFLTTAFIHKTMTEGVMRQQSAALSEPDKIAVAEYLTRSSLAAQSQAVAPEVCTGNALDFDWREPVSGDNWGLDRGNRRSLSDARAGLAAADIETLELKWAFAYPDAQRARSHPLVAGGAVFVGSQSGGVFALDAATGCLRWRFQAGAEVRTGFALQRDGGANANRPQLYFGDLLGRVYAIDANTGRELWRAQADPHPATTITGTPTYYEGQLYVPVSSLEVVSASADDYPCCHFRGSVLALDATSGEVVWQTYTVSEKASPQDVNRTGTRNYGPSGAPIWNSPAIDVERGQLYVGTGENYSSPATLTSDAILALSLENGEIRWVYQATPNDAWNTSCGRQEGANCPQEDGPDFDFGAAAVLATDSRGRDVVLGAQKSGEVHALDPDTGTRFWHTKLGRGGLHGGVHFGIAVHGDRVFVPISDADDGRVYATPPNPGLYAINLLDGTSLWLSPQPDQCRGRAFCERGIGAAITATESLVFAGALDGYVRIHDAQSGALLRSIDTTTPVTTVNGEQANGGSMDGGTAPLPFNGRLYINSGYNFAGHMGGNVLLVYGLPE